MFRRDPFPVFTGLSLMQGFWHQVLPALLLQFPMLVAAQLLIDHGANCFESPASPVPETIG